MRPRTLLMIGLVCAVGGSGCQKDTAEEHVKKGSAYLEQSQVSESIVEFRRALQIDPQLGDAHLKLADAYVRANDTNNAIKEYVRAADLLPDNADAQIKAAEGLLLAGRFDALLPSFDLDAALAAYGEARTELETGGTT